jgi:cytoskeletal protein RodZ
MARGNFGERLKRERELREVTLDEINSATRISNRFLEAMENEDWEKLPGGVFNRGFVRSVARYLGLDEEALLAEYDMAHGAQEQAAPKRDEVRIPSPPKWIPVAAVLGLLLLLVGCIAGGIYAWRYFAARRAARQPGTAMVLDSGGNSHRRLSITAKDSSACCWIRKSKAYRWLERRGDPVQLFYVGKT